MSFFWRDWDEPIDDEGGFEKARNRMVERQLEPRGIHEPVVLAAMRAVPREEFVPKEARRQAYRDGAMPIGSDQTISQPYMVAVMTQLLLTPRIAAGAKFKRSLEIGGGSGYQAAILSLLSDEVVTIERKPELAKRAAATLSRLGYANVTVVHGDGTLGHAERAPFDAIVVAAAAPAVPPSLREQLALGGKLVVPVGERGMQELVTLHRGVNGDNEDRSTRCVFVPLIGEQGWEEEEW